MVEMKKSIKCIEYVTSKKVFILVSISINIYYVNRINLSFSSNFSHR